MKKILLISSIATLLSLTNLAHADFLFNSTDADACKTIPGNWQGTGKASHWLIGICNYHGTGTASAIDAAGNFNFDVALQRDSGSLLCPASHTDRFAGHCVNGKATLVTSYGTLNGNFSGDSAHAQGTLTISGLDVDVEFNFQHVK